MNPLQVYSLIKGYWALWAARVEELGRLYGSVLGSWVRNFTTQKRFRGLGFKVRVLGSRAQGLEFRVSGLGVFTTKKAPNHNPNLLEPRFLKC